MGDPSHPPKPDAFGAIPDLDLDLAPAPRPAEVAPAPPARPAPTPAKPAAAGTGSALDYFGTGFDEDHFGGSADAGPAAKTSGAYAAGGLDFDEDSELAGGSLEIASYRPPAPAGSTAPMPGADSGAPPRGLSGAPGRVPMPVVQADSSAASLLANYGPPPKAAYLAPLYTWRVLNRQRVLRQEIVRLNREFEQAEAGRDQLLANLVSGMRSTLEADSRFEANFAGVRQLETIAGERGAALSQTNAQFEAQKTELTNALAQVQAQIDERRVLERSAADEVARVEELVTRVTAKQKRVMIEVRSLTQAGQTAAGGPNLPIPDDYKLRIRDLEAQAQAMQPEVDARRQELNQAQAALSGVRRELGTLAQYVRRIQDQERTISRQFGKELGQHSAGLSTAQKELNAALATVGHAVLASRDGFSLDPGAVEEIAAAEREVHRLAESRELHIAALDVHDAEAVKRGIVFAVATVVGVIVLLVVLIALL